MKQILFSCAVLVSLSFYSNTLKAQTPAPAADTTKKDAPLVIAGYADVYYRASSNSKKTYTAFTTANNAFSLASANVQISKETEKFAFMADLFLGERADQTAYNYFSGTTPSILKQLYVVYKPSKKVKLTAGEFTTFFGYELIESPSNLNYSTSYTFSNGPFFHTGLKADFTLSDNFSATLGIFEPTDTKGLTSGQKYVGGQLGYTQGTFKAFVNFLTGSDTLKNTYTTFDFTSSWQATTALGLGFNVTNKSASPKTGDSNSWLGTALYVNYAVSPSFTLAARGEIFNDSKNAAGITDLAMLENTSLKTVGTKITAFTLSGNLKAENFTFVPELRYDNSDAAIFNGKTSDLSFLLAAIYKF